MRRNILIVTLIAAATIVYAAKEPSPTYNTAEEAKDALAAAAGNGFEAVKKVMGVGSEDVLNTGDPVEDKNILDRFSQRAKQKMSVTTDEMNPDRAILLVGDEEVPFAVPLKRAKGKWYFDIEEGKTEIYHRLIGGNELDAIHVCRGFVEAQEIYAQTDWMGTGVPQYARKLVSSEGKKDGLYWPGDDSPVSAAIAKATLEGYGLTSGKPTAYHGYHFKLLTGQGSAAPGGARDYLVRGLMIGGFALVAWPAEYGHSGIMTFIVNQDGVVYEKDLGRQTGQAARAMTKFNPDSTWRVTPES